MSCGQIRVICKWWIVWPADNCQILSEDSLVEKDDGCTRILRLRTYLLLIFASFIYGGKKLTQIFLSSSCTDIPSLKWNIFSVLSHLWRRYDIKYPWSRHTTNATCFRGPIVRQTEVMDLSWGLRYSSRRSYRYQDTFLVVIVLSFYFISKGVLLL